jgi:penicillin-binding protein 2
MKLGKAFSDSVIIEKTSRTRLPKDGRPSWWLGSGRALIFATLLFLSMFILTIRLVHLTLIGGHELRSLADGNRTRELVRHAPRGRILDRTGNALADNIPQYRLLKPCEGSSPTQCVQYLSKQDGEELVKKGLPSGSFVEVDYARTYTLGDKAAHAVGYVGELSQEELSRDYYSLRNYHRGDRIGRSGAEAVYEEKLRGRDGRELVEVNANGNIVRVLGRDKEIPGEDITLSIDSGLQITAATAFPAGMKGAVVITKPLTGEVLALYSSPSYDPNNFSRGLSEEEYSGLIDNPDRPLFDRAIGGTYPPGSTFKIVTALAGLEEGAITPDTTVDDTGVITIGPFSFANWYFTEYGKTEGNIQLVRAITRSNDIYFYKAGERIGITKLADWARKVGIGKPLGIELGGEASGLMPDPDWKNKQFQTAADLEARNNLWYLGDTYHAAIGQGYVLATPLQVNTWTNVVASSGKLCRPTIEKKGAGESQSRNCKDLGIQKETLSNIKQGMTGACAPGGTGWPLFGFGVPKPSDQPGGDTTAASSSARLIAVPVACKTGTAEFGIELDKTHAWFSAFAPVPKEFVDPQILSQTAESITGDPEISVTVIIEGGGEGSTAGGPVVKKIFEEWFGR